MTAAHAAVAVVGAGPAGCVLATRLAQLGHDVTLFERSRFPRRQLGESLSPGVTPLLASFGAGRVLGLSGARSLRDLDVCWGHGWETRRPPGGAGHVVDRGRFDCELLALARSNGVRVLQPARVRAATPTPHGWTLDVDGDSGEDRFSATFLADATGRARGPRHGRFVGDVRTLAMYAYMDGADVARPALEAGESGWSWIVPLPDGTCNALAFVDLEAGGDSCAVPERFEAVLACSPLLRACCGATRLGPIRGVEATPWVASTSVTATSIRVGDSALALDPLSSTGVQKAIQTALSGAVVTNTLLRRPREGDIARRFYREMIETAAARHQRWAEDCYREVAAPANDRFWAARAGSASPATESDSIDVAPDRATIEAIARDQCGLTVCSRLRVGERPCLDGDFVVSRTVVSHPALKGECAYVGGVDVAALLQRVRAGSKATEIAAGCGPNPSSARALAVVMFLAERGVLVPIRP